MSWKSLESQSPEIAEFAKARLHNIVAYLATIRKDGSPRIHPFTPIIGEGHFFVFTEPDSPKGNDLRRDGRYSVHCAVIDTSGESGECMITGRAKFIEDPRCARWRSESARMIQPKGISFLNLILKAL